MQTLQLHLHTIRKVSVEKNRSEIPSFTTIRTRYSVKVSGVMLRTTLSVW